MRIHGITHADFESLAAIETWIQARNHTLTVTKAYNDEQLPAVNEFDMLILMGGPQSPKDVDKYPYLAKEMQLIRASIAQDKYILGICLGAQLITEALGAATQSSPKREVGMFPVVKTSSGQHDPYLQHIPEESLVMHWHNDMPGELANMEILLESAACPCQAYRIGQRIYGFQCHLELTRDSVELLIKHGENDLLPGDYVQDVQSMRNNDYRQMNENLFKFLDSFSADV